MTRSGLDARLLIRWLSATCLLVLLSMAPVAAQSPSYDHPLFTGSLHVPPVRSFDQTHLRLDLRLDPANHQLAGEALLHIRPLDASLDTLLLHARDLAIDSVWIGLTDSSKVATPFVQRAPDSLFIPLHTLQDPDAPFEVRIRYQARPQKGLYFIQHGTGQRQVWSHNAPEDARYWIPLIDSPGDKLTSDLWITADSSLQVLANGQWIEETMVDQGQRRTHYRQTQPHGPHHIMLAVGSFEVVQETTRATDLTYWVDPNRRDDVERTFGETVSILQFLADWLDVRFPWDRYAQVALRQYPFHASGSTGISTFSDAILLDARAEQDHYQNADLAPALIKQWFGRLVTPSYWSDSWLQEGFAAYLSALYEEAQEGPDAFALALHSMRDRYLEEAALYRRPLVWNRWTDPSEMFDAHSAYRGAWVLRMLHRQLGDQRFREVLAYYLTEHRLDTANTDDFKQVLTTIAGQDFDAFFSLWVDGAGHPELHVSYAMEPGDEALSITIEQNQEGPLVPDHFDLDLPVAIYTLTDTLLFDLPVEERTQTLTLSLTSLPRYLVVDPEQTVLADATVEQPVQAWVAQLRDAPNAAHRVEAARALAAFQEDPALVIGLRTALTAEQVPAVRKAIVQTLASLPPAPAVKRILVEAIGDADARVRVAVLEALGEYDQDAQVHDVALGAAQNDQSYMVQAAAVKILARTSFPEVYDVIRSALITPSHRDVIRQSAFEALPFVDLAPGDGLALALQYTPTDQRTEVRMAAIGYLQTIADDSRAALEHLIFLLTDEDIRVRGAAITSLVAIDSPRAHTALQKHLDVEVQPSLRLAIEQSLQNQPEHAE